MPPSYRPPQPQGGSSGPFLVLLLILSCLVLGVVLAWGVHERTQRAVLSARNEKLANAYVIILAKRSDLVSFLTDPRTHLHHLAGAGAALGQSATVAWQQATGRGLLIGERVPPLDTGHVYVLWHLDKSSHPTRCGAFQQDVSGTCYQFTLRQSVESTGGFQVSIEANSDVDKPGRIVYEAH
jgi:hypothetical protein